MKKMYLLGIAFAISSVVCAQTVFINEIHYDNAGGDSNQGIEIAGPAGTNLVGYRLLLYRSNGTIYYSVIISGIIPNQSDNLGVLWFTPPTSVDIQNGPRDGMALVDNSGSVIQFISYEGVITAIEGAANGMTSVDIGVSESEATRVGHSLQLIGTGTTYSDFSWSAPSVATPGLPNNSQTLPIFEAEIQGLQIFPNPVVNGKFAIKTASKSNKFVKIYSLFGNQVFDKIVEANESIEVSNLTSGIYIIKVEQEGKIGIQKLVIQ